MCKVSMSVCNADLWYIITIKKNGKIGEICCVPGRVSNVLFLAIKEKKIGFCWFVGFSLNIILVVTSAFYAII